MQHVSHCLLLEEQRFEIKAFALDIMVKCVLSGMHQHYIYFGGADQVASSEDKAYLRSSECAVRLS